MTKRNWIHLAAATVVAWGCCTATPMMIAEDNDPRTTVQGNEHPLMPAIRWAGEIEKNINENIKDYTCTMIKQERVNGTLLEPEYLTCKIRHQPFSVYMGFIKPEAKKGQEAIWVDGKNDGTLVGHGVGLQKMVGTVHLKPTSPFAMKDNLYPITEAGVLNLTRRLLEVGVADSKYGECEVKFLKNAKINGVTCTCLQVEHPVPRNNFKFHLARVFIDDQLNIPIRYEAYEWPTKQGGDPVLHEVYTYVNMKTNVGLTDADFDPKNPSYGYNK